MSLISRAAATPTLRAYQSASTPIGISRRWLTHRLDFADTAARTRLRFTLVMEALLGLTIVLAAGFLPGAGPAMQEPPLSPLSWQFSLVSVDADPDLRAEVIVSLGLIGLASCWWRLHRDGAGRMPWR